MVLASSIKKMLRLWRTLEEKKKSTHSCQILSFSRQIIWISTDASIHELYKNVFVENQYGTLAKKSIWHSCKELCPYTFWSQNVVHRHSEKERTEVINIIYEYISISISISIRDTPRYAMYPYLYPYPRPRTYIHIRLSYNMTCNWNRRQVRCTATLVKFRDSRDRSSGDIQVVTETECKVY